MDRCCNVGGFGYASSRQRGDLVNGSRELRIDRRSEQSENELRRMLGTKGVAERVELKVD